MPRFIAVVLLLSSLCARAQTAGKRPFTFEDMMALKRISEPAVSPDGKWVAYSAVQVDLEKNTRQSRLWIIPGTGGDSRQLPVGDAGGERPRWSPDGRQLLFVSDRSGSSQAWLASFDPAAVSLGEPRKLTSISTGAGGALWFPDGKNILFTSEVWPDCKDDACNRQRDDELAAAKVKASIFTRLFYRHWSSYNYGKRTHIFVQAVEGGTPLDLTPGDHDAPPFTLGGQDMYAVAPDGREVAFTSNVDEVEATSTNNEIFIVPVSGGTPKKISVSSGSDSTPLYSPDGKWIAWRMQVRAGYESDRFRLVLYDRQSGQIRNLTENLDRWVESVAWAPDSKGLYFTADDKGESPVYYVSIAGNDAARIAGGTNDELTVTGDGRTLLFTRMSLQAPNEIYALSLPATSPSDREAAPRQLTHLNDSVLSQVSMQPLEPFWFAGAQHAQVEGFVVKPPNFDPQKKYPVKFLIHGGPQGAWGDDWSYRWNPELFAANGYVVVMINPRGSTGYGQKFIDEINGDWGGRAYRDLMLGLDYAEKTYPFIDKSRECALGASYGGYMANWIEGNTTRFKCIVSHDGMFNTESAYGTTEELWFNEWEFKGTPWTNRPLYRKWSPHLRAAAFKTPMLVVHGQLDYRLDVSEGFQLFTTLQRLHVPSKMLYFPDEGHWVLKPQNSRLWYKTVNDWVDQWTK
jgi:dipeptidyl aminopeptidase/acylaminoacyl peptidase